MSFQHDLRDNINNFIHNFLGLINLNLINLRICSILQLWEKSPKIVFPSLDFKILIEMSYLKKYIYRQIKSYHNSGSDAVNIYLSDEFLLEWPIYVCFLWLNLCIIELVSFTLLLKQVIKIVMERFRETFMNPVNF